ncbi:MAG: serine protease [Mycobacterium sp.]|nr:serine protease [Mycobacterium sp.]
MRIRVVLALAMAALAAAFFIPTTASAAGTGAIHPGVMTHTAGAQCTANFIFRNGGDTYIGQAAHCSGTGSETDTNGCTAASLPLGTPVTVDGASKPGVLAYSSWLTMQSIHETDPNACAYNDIALVKLDPADVANVDPSVPFFGGPTGVASSTQGAGARIYSYGNSELRGGISLLSPKFGLVVQDTAGGWSHNVYTLTPGIPGDSGSAFLDSSGKALGVLSTLEFAPLVASNNVGDLSHMLDYAHSHGLPGLQLVTGGAFSSIV